jgi:predicted nucleic acid-binding protein
MKLIIYDEDIHHKEFCTGPLMPLTTASWAQSDTEKLFDENWKNPDTKTKLIKYGWDKHNIQYKSNDFGFRMNTNFMDIIPGECDFYLGCSITFGTGLNLEDTWAWKLSEKTGRICINLGWNGAGIETQYRLLRAWAKKLKPRCAYTLGYFNGRRELLASKDNIHILSIWASDSKPWRETYLRLTTEHELMISRIRAFDAMRAVCMDHNIELYTLNNLYRKEIFDITDSDRAARDLLHFGCSWHTQISDLPKTYWQRLV